MSEETKTPEQETGDVSPESEKDEQINKLTSQVEGLVEELKAERQKKQDAEAERDAVKVQTTQVEKPAEDEVAQAASRVVEELLSKRDQADATKNRENAEAAFKAKYSEFHPDNDPGEVKYASFEQVLARINTSGLKTQAEFTSAFEDAYRLFGGNSSSQEDNTISNPYASTSSSPSGDSGKPTGEERLTDVELRAIKKFGWTQDQYLKQRKAKPAYVDSLLRYVK